MTTLPQPEVSAPTASVLAELTRAIATRPQDPGLRLRRACVLLEIPGRLDDAVAELRRVVALAPRAAEAHLALGNALKRSGRLAAATLSLDEACRLAPENAVAWLNAGVARLELGRAVEAVRGFRRAVALEPNRAEAHNILGAALIETGELAEAAKVLRHAIALRPDYAAARHNLARVCKSRGEAGKAIALYREALTLRADPTTHSNLLLALNYDHATSPDAVFAEHRAWQQRYAAAFACARPALREPRRDRRLRVGFVSPDLVNHAVAYFFEPLLEQRDRGEWEVFCYSDAPKPDAVSARLRARSDAWHDVGGQSDEAVAQQIRRDGIDVLVDLAGHTARNRLLVFARQPAPVQVTWLGYPNTTGLDAIDFRVTDGVADPMGGTDEWHSETLLRLPGPFLCYRPPGDSPSVGALPALSSPAVTFGSFSNLAKISDACVALWSRVLNGVPGSRLVLQSRGLGDSETANATRSRFADGGVGPERLILDGSLVSTAAHLARYHAIDIALDPFPYNGTTTTCEALWMGVPVVTLAGRTHAARVGASLLHHLGHSEWIAESADAYVQIAAQLSADRPGLARRRALLRDEMRHGALCDGVAFARTFAAALRRAWCMAIERTRGASD